MEVCAVSGWSSKTYRLLPWGGILHSCWYCKVVLPLHLSWRFQHLLQFRLSNWRVCKTVAAFKCLIWDLRAKTNTHSHWREYLKWKIINSGYNCWLQQTTIRRSLTTSPVYISTCRKCISETHSHKEVFT